MQTETEMLVSEIVAGFVPCPGHVTVYLACDVPGTVAELSRRQSEINVRLYLGSPDVEWRALNAVRS